MNSFVMKCYLLLLIFIYYCYGNDQHVSLANKENLKYRLHYHIMAPSGWINDPNGFVFFGGDYHVFYQYNPYDITPGNIHWGHVKSQDLVHWKHLPIALTPNKDYDRNGCFSGTAIENENTLVLFYTGNVDEVNSTFFSTQNQNMALSTDGIIFEKFSGNPVIPFPPDDGQEDFRDPKVWKYENNWYLIMGNQIKDDGRVVLYKSENPERWEYVGVLASSNGNLGFMWECPDFFELNGSYVLIFSPQGIESEGDKYANLFQTGYVLGSYSYADNKFDYGNFSEIDSGHDFYAMQTMESPDGRRIGIGWMDMWKSDFPEAVEGWAGALTIPRELYLLDGQLIQRPVREMKLLRKRTLFKEKLNLQGEREIRKIEAAEIMINSKFCESVNEFGITLNDEAGSVVKFYYKFSDKSFNLDRGDGDLRRKMLDKMENLKMDVFVDASSIEIFLNNGETVFTSRIYPNKIPKLLVYATGNCNVDVDIEVIELENIWI